MHVDMNFALQFSCEMNILRMMVEGNQEGMVAETKHTMKEAKTGKRTASMAVKKTHVDRSKPIKRLIA